MCALQQKPKPLDLEPATNEVTPQVVQLIEAQAMQIGKMGVSIDTLHQGAVSSIHTLGKYTTAEHSFAPRIALLETQLKAMQGRLEQEQSYSRGLENEKKRLATMLEEQQGRIQALLSGGLTDSSANMARLDGLLSDKEAMEKTIAELREKLIAGESGKKVRCLPARVIVLFV